MYRPVRFRIYLTGRFVLLEAQARIFAHHRDRSREAGEAVRLVEHVNTKNRCLSGTGLFGFVCF
jgi:hypothetical protein